MDKALIIKARNIGILACLSAALLACGGGGGGGSDKVTSPSNPGSPSIPGSPDPTPSNPGSVDPGTPAPPAKVAHIIDYYGDSTVWGYASGSGARVAKPAPLAFDEALPVSPDHTVRNEGVNSSDACQLLNGRDGKHPAWEQQMTNSNASIVILNHGINDQWRYDVNTYKGCLKSLAQTAKSKGKKIIFETPNPTRDSGAGGLDVYVNAMKDVARQENVPVIDQHSYLTNYLQGKSVYTICPDGLHPTDAVYIMKGKYAAQVFATLNL